jgi:hypothetical protein
MNSVPTAPTIPAPRLDRAGKATIGLLAFLSLGAFAGGASLVAKPDGSIMQMPLSLLAGSPFADYFIPGLILGGLFGVGSLVVVFLGIRKVRLAPFLAFAIGCAQMIWIVVELAIIKELSFLHPTCFALGLGIAACAVPWGLPTLRGWQAVRR